MATRTQIYLTEEQRTRLDTLRRHEGKTLAELVREAIEVFLAAKQPDLAQVLEQTFGAAPRMSVPSREEWDRHA